MLAKLFVNDVEKKVSEKTLAVYAAILTTKNPGAVTVRNAVIRAGGDGFISQVEASGTPDDKFVVVREIRKGTQTGKITGESLRHQFVYAMRLALTPEKWQAKITVDGIKADSDGDGDSDEIEIL